MSAPTRAPMLGFRLNAGVKALLQSAAGVAGAALLAWITDPATLAQVTAVLPAKWAAIAGALITAIGFARNHFKHRETA